MNANLCLESHTVSGLVKAKGAAVSQDLGGGGRTIYLWREFKYQMPRTRKKINAELQMHLEIDFLHLKTKDT